MGIHESTASRIVCRVSAALARLYPQFVRMPTAQEHLRIQTEFFNIARFPRVLGIVDCTHIRTISPGRYYYKSTLYLLKKTVMLMDFKDFDIKGPRYLKRDIGNNDSKSRDK